jgi:acetyl-CoA carboxylase carboxyl transferase subunit alpha
MNIIDEVVPEPLGGAHRDPQKMTETIKEVINRNLNELSGLRKEELLKARYKKFRDIGVKH